MSEPHEKLRQTPLHENHLALGAKMGEFAGWELPLSCGGVSDEVWAVRHEVGLFDVSHMGLIVVSGAEATRSLGRLLTNAVAQVKPGRAVYSPMCNERGGTVDDLIAYRVGEDEWQLVVNASRAETDLAWMHDHSTEGTVFDLRWEAIIAVQGPLARTMVSALLADDAAMLPRNGFLQHALNGVLLTIACTGYTGEDGFELIAPPHAAPALWQRLTEAGAVACGLAARDVCRLEAGLPLYGHELTEERSPLECGYGWTVKLDKPDFIGKEALRTLADSSDRARVVGLEMEGRAVPREGYQVTVGGKPVGEVTSGTFSPTLRKGVAMAFVDHAVETGDAVEVCIRDRSHGATVVPLPFYHSDSM